MSSSSWLTGIVRDLLCGRALDFSWRAQARKYQVIQRLQFVLGDRNLQSQSVQGITRERKPLQLDEVLLGGDDHLGRARRRGNRLPVGPGVRVMVRVLEYPHQVRVDLAHHGVEGRGIGKSADRDYSATRKRRRAFVPFPPGRGNQTVRAQARMKDAMA